MKTGQSSGTPRTTPLVVRRLFAAVLAITLLATSLSSQGADRPSERFRGGKVAWARLKHRGPFWFRHAESDDNLINFIRAKTTLNIDITLRDAPVNDLATMVAYPFLFADTLQYLNSAEQRNLTEYLRRGGFIFIDACSNSGINPSAQWFLEDHLLILSRMFPDFVVKEAPPSHELFSIYFKLKRFPPQFRSRDGHSYVDRGGTNPLRLLYSGDRLIGILSLSAIQCGWSGIVSDINDQGEFMAITTNIYLYAITR